MLDGPVSGVVSSLTYGRFAQVMGQLLAAGVGVGEAMQVGRGAVTLPLARARLEAAAAAVRSGASLSQALSGVRGFPDTIARMAMIGEQTGALGDLLARAGALEAEAAARRMDRFAKALGPALIILLGAVVGLLMGGLLGGLAGVGEGVF